MWIKELQSKKDEVKRYFAKNAKNMSTDWKKVTMKDAFRYGQKDAMYTLIGEGVVQELMAKENKQEL